MGQFINRLVIFTTLVVALSTGVFSVRASSPSGACAVTPDKVDGQGFNVSGLGFNVSGLGFNVSGLGFSVSGLGFNVSGLSLDQIVKDIWNNPVTPAWLTQLLPGVEGGAGYNSVPTAILIVDDFSTPTSHGYDVRKSFVDLLGAINAVRDPDPQITLVNVDINGANLDTTLIASKIRTTVNSMLPATQHFAVNMSFGLVPCDDPVGVTLTDSESGAIFRTTKPFSFTQMQTTMASMTPIRNAAVIPILECTVHQGNGNFTAYYGYDNKNTVNVTIPIGSKNRFEKNPQGRGQPTVFVPGRQMFVFKVDGRREPPEWKLRGPDNKEREAEKNRKPCQGTPTLKTVQAGLNGYGGVAQFAETKLGIPSKFTDDYLEYLANKGAAMDDPLNGLRPLLRGYLTRSANEAADSDPNTRFALIPVASSGNFRPILGAAPLAPARFPETIAVGATLGTFGNLWVMSHDGNVLAPGAGYVLDRDANGNITRVGAGTSFAAPYVTTLSALWLTYPNACQFTGGRVPLSYDVTAPNAKSTNAVVSIVGGNRTSPLACSKNTPPTLSLNGNLTISEGQQIAIGIVSDVDGDAVTVTSSLSGSSASNSAGVVMFTHNDGPLAPQLVTITATDARGAQTTATFTLTVTNVAPTAQFSASPLTISAGQTSTLALVSPFDPGSVDTAAGFNYAFDCGLGAGAVSTGSQANLVCSYSSAGSFNVRGLIRDKDGAISESPLVVTVNPVVTPTSCYAMSVVSYTPGTTKGGGALAAGRTDPSKALGAPQIIDSDNFVSLGFGNGEGTGTLVLDFAPNVITNGVGLDVRIWETSFNDSTKSWSQYPEAANVYASQNLDQWVLIGTTSDKDQAYDLASLPWARYIKLVDASDRSKFGANDDSFDVDGVEGFSCAPVPTDDEHEGEDDHEGEGESLATQEAPVVIDSDGDSVSDASDNCPTLQTTNITDTDSDGVGDACDETPNGVIVTPEATAQVDVCAVDAVDTDGDTISNTCDTDDDNDGLLDTQEATYGTNPLVADTDGDGISDGAEVTNGTNPLDAASPGNTGS